MDNNNWIGMRLMQANGRRVTKLLLSISKIIWIATVLVSLFALIWFVLGSTAGFQRGVDLITTVVFFYCGIPIILFIAFSVYHLYRKWRPRVWVMLSFWLFSCSQRFSFLISCIRIHIRAAGSRKM